MSLYNSDQGKAIEEIADIYRVSRQTIYKWDEPQYESYGIDGLDTAEGKGHRAIIRIDNEAEVGK